MKQSNHHFSLSIEINSSKEKLWKRLIDVPSWHIWDTELKSAKLKGVFEEGAKGVFLPKKGPELHFVLTEVKATDAYVFKTKMPLGWLVIKRTIEEKKDTVIFTDDIAFTGLLKYLFGSILGQSFKRVLPEVLENLKRVVEEGAAIK